MKKCLGSIALVCLLAAVSSSPTMYAQSWAHTWGGGSTDTLVATSRDTDGNLYAAGSTSSFGVAGGVAGSDALLLKYDSSGNIIWTKTWGGTSDDYATAVEVDPSGNNIYVTGRTQSFGGGWYDVFLLKFDAAGNLLWNKTWGGGSYDSGNDIAFDSSGNILVAAEAYSYNPAGTGSSSATILKFTPDGNLLWSRVWGANAVGGPTYNGGYSLDVDGSGNIFLSGITWDYRVSPNHNSIFIVKFDSSGNFLWNRNWAGPGEDETFGAKTVRADVAGNVYVAGRTTSQPCASGSSGCDFDVLLLKLDSAGNLVWSRTWKPDIGYDTAIGLAFDASGNLVLTGAKDEAGPTETALLLRFDPAGNVLPPGLAWSGGPGAVGSAVLLDPAGDVFIAGNAPNDTGLWQPITGAVGTENGTLSAPLSAVASPTATPGSPSGIVTSPSGVVDTGGGGQDAFLSMIPASTFPSSSQPVALPSPSPLHFPNQPVNTTSSAKAISVANTGTGTLSITASASIGGANAADFAIASGTTCLSGATVATATSCVIDVTFTPSTTSSESATLFIHDNEANSPQSVVLTGTGIVQVAPPVVPGAVTILDPVSTLLLGNQITANRGDLASKGRPVQGIAADGISQVVFRIPVFHIGDKVTATLLSDQCSDPANPSTCAASTSSDDDGGLFNPGTVVASGQSLPNLVSDTAQTSVPDAFIAYRAPIDYARTSVPSDVAHGRRFVYLLLSYSSGGSQIVPLTILRAPVVLVHGFNDNSHAWDHFSPLINDTARFQLFRVNYGQPLYIRTDVQPCLGTYCAPSYQPTSYDIQSTTPAIDMDLIHQSMIQSDLGFTVNAPDVREQILADIAAFTLGKNPLSIPAAGVAADIVAHSMGGLVARYLTTMPGFTMDSPYGHGFIHKLITLGTPHFGTPQATLALLPASVCSRDLIASNGTITISGATASGSVFLSGATGEFSGDGIGTNMSKALMTIKAKSLPVPMAAIAGDVAPYEWSVGPAFYSQVLYSVCPGDELAKHFFTGSTFESMFDPSISAANPNGGAGGRESDAIVPLTSALMDPSIMHTSSCGVNQCFDGYAHSEALTAFFSSYSVKYLLDNSLIVSTEVENLLNTPINMQVWKASQP